MEVSRRGGLSLLLMLCTGCMTDGVESSPFVSQTEASSSRTDSTGGTKTDAVIPASKIQSVNPELDEEWASISASSPQQSLTKEKPATLKLSIKNESDDPQTILGDFDKPNSWSCDTGPTNSGLVLVPLRATVIKASDNCWTYSNLEWDDSGGDSAIRTTEIGPGKSVTANWELWWEATTESSVCIPSGEYEFSRLAQRSVEREDSNIVLDIQLVA